MKKNNFSYIEGLCNTELVQGVTVYDIEDKKLVLLFSSGLACSKYTDIYGLSAYIKKKNRCKKNKFNRLICFRYATIKQLELLNGETMACFDDRYIISTQVKLKSQFRINERLIKRK